MSRTKQEKDRDDWFITGGAWPVWGETCPRCHSHQCYRTHDVPSGEIGLFWDRICAKCGHRWKRRDKPME